MANYKINNDGNANANLFNARIGDDGFANANLCNGPVDDTNITNFIDDPINNLTKFTIFQRTNILKGYFIYPFSIHLKRGKTERRYLRKNNFNKYRWLEYSQFEFSEFCKYCTLFLKSNIGSRKNSEKLKNSVTNL